MRTAQPITHERVKFFKSLQERKTRDSEGLYLLEGARLVRDAMLAGAHLPLLLVRREEEEKYREIIAYVLAGGGQAYLGDEKALSRACATKTPQGICAAAALPENAPVSGRYILALDHVKDPGNMGTVLRTAQAFGVSCVVLSPGCCDPFSPKCVRSAGRAQSFHRVYRDCRNLPSPGKGYSVVGGHLAAGQHAEAQNASASSAARRTATEQTARLYGAVPHSMRSNAKA
ncbi:MAG: TrmH family RNA methyltransferase [Christensenellales bacterium]